ncbi:MAG: hypothetical protein K0S68_124 [Candidatus Saccharibacteria bacterium]|jgi:hypothetical protein|nr:hypothetical protein [Candidatus Saccharibacteria bacterium]
MSHERFVVIARVSPSELNTERRYLLMEREMAKREMAKLPERSWLPFSYPAIGLLRRNDWQHYLHELDKYEKALDRHEHETEAGLTRLSFEVINMSDDDDRDVKVHVMVHGGRIFEAKKPPTRPKRIDGAPDKTEGRPKWHGMGFVRSGIHIGKHGVESQFRSLEAGDAALVVNHPLAVHLGGETVISYEISSHNLPEGQRGKVRME